MIYRNCICIKLYFFCGDEKEEEEKGFTRTVKLQKDALGFTPIPPLFHFVILCRSNLSHHFLNTSVCSFLHRICAFHQMLQYSFRFIILSQHRQACPRILFFIFVINLAIFSELNCSCNTHFAFFINKVLSLFNLL